MKTFSFCLLLLGACTDLAASDAPRLIPFQGRLSDSSGKPIPDGIRLIQFQIYSEPSAGSVLWAGELHRATINGGLVNVILGSRNPLPNDRLDQPDKSFFHQPLYLQITVDANDDDQITAVDPPLLPRQTILPVVFANESANSRKLAGFDWSVLFGANNPAEGRISGSRLATNSVSAEHLVPGTIISNQIAFGGVAGVNIAPHSISSNLLAAEAISSENIAKNSITFDRLSPRSVSTNDPVRAMVGEIAISHIAQGGDSTETNQWSSRTPGQATLVSNLVATVAASGRPIVVALTTGSESFSSSVRGYSTIEIEFLRDGEVVSKQQSSTPSTWITIPPASFLFFDFPFEKRSYTYSVRASISEAGTGGARYIVFNNVRLIAFEL